MLAPQETYMVNHTNIMDGNNKQLLINIQPYPRNGIPVAIKALLDTGTEANLVRSDLLSGDSFRPAREP